MEKNTRAFENKVKKIFYKHDKKTGIDNHT